MAAAARAERIYPRAACLGLSLVKSLTMRR